VDLWEILRDVLILLTAALLLGFVMQILRQRPVLGYILAGILLGPHGFAVIHNQKAVEDIAYLGVSLLLFAIGLEFSWSRLRSFGTAGLGGGSLQVLFTGGAAYALSIFLGVAPPMAFVLGAVTALSSTAFVLRLLAERSELDSVQGRHAVGILLLQDLAVVPLILVVEILVQGGGAGAFFLRLGKALLVLPALAAVFVILFRLVLPRILKTSLVHRNREFLVLLAAVTALGSSWLAHHLGYSAALGAFLAGMLLGDSPFATQFRADMGALRTILVTVFFSSIGLLADPRWMLEYWFEVGLLVLCVLLGKTIIVTVVLKLFRLTLAHAVATGLCLAQMGEFGFMLATLGKGAILDDHLFMLIVSATIVSLFFTPYLMAGAMPVGRRVDRILSFGRSARSRPGAAEASGEAACAPEVVLIGFGPAGREVAARLERLRCRLLVLDLNPKIPDIAREYGFEGQVGDASQIEVLEHAGITGAGIVVVALPHPETVSHVVENVKALSPKAHVVARSRYNIHRHRLERAGADLVVDEERMVGLRIAEDVEAYLEDI